MLAARLQVTTPPLFFPPRSCSDPGGFGQLFSSSRLSVCVAQRRVTEYISSLEHTHFSDGSLQPPPLAAITQQGDPVDLGLELELELSGQFPPKTAELGSGQPAAQPLSMQELLREGGRGGRSMVDLKSGSLMSGNSAAKAVCMLSTQADR